MHELGTLSFTRPLERFVRPHPLQIGDHAAPAPALRQGMREKRVADFAPQGTKPVRDLVTSPTQQVTGIGHALRKEGSLKVASRMKVLTNRD